MRNAALAGMLLLLCYALPRLEAQDPMNTNALNPKEEKIVAIAMYTSRGDMANLKTALNAGLDAGVSVNEIKEILVQLYAYCGFPRSLNALANFMTVVQERQSSGIQDAVGALPGPRPKGSSLDYGTANQTKLCGAPVKGALFDFAPAIDEYLKAHLFGDIFARDNLDWRTRELATIAALAALPGAESQLKAHIGIGKNNGITDTQVAAILETVQSNTVSPFPRGGENTAFAQYFSGKCYLSHLTEKESQLHVPVYNVTFEPGCRNNWHRHTGGQMLIAVGGVGFYQERGKAAVKMLPGDVIEIAPEVEHWHGASPDSWFAHLSVECNPAINKNTWLEPVTDEEYRAAVSGK